MKKRNPKHIQQEIDKEGVSDSDLQIMHILMAKAFALGLVVETSSGFYPTLREAMLVEALPKPKPWFNTNDERIGLIALAMNNFEHPFEED